jgi:hypothetical protein
MTLCCGGGCGESEVIETPPVPVPRTASKKESQLIRQSGLTIAIRQGPENAFRSSLTDKTRDGDGIAGLNERDGVLGRDNFLFNAVGNLKGKGVLRSVHLILRGKGAVDRAVDRRTQDHASVSLGRRSCRSLGCSDPEYESHSGVCAYLCRCPWRMPNE